MLVVFFITLVFILLLVFTVILVKDYNKLKQIVVKVNEARAAIEVVLVKRYDTLKQSSDCVKRYVKYEADVLKELTAIRRGVSLPVLQRSAIEQRKVIDRIFAVSENYPNLKTDNLYVQLQQQISAENEQLSAAKYMYNANVSLLNQMCVSVPTSFIAYKCGIKPMEFFNDEALNQKREINFDM